MKRMLLLFICIFAASNLRLDAGRKRKAVSDLDNRAIKKSKIKKDPAAMCPICHVSLYYKTDDEGYLIDKDGARIQVDCNDQIIDSADSVRLILLEDSKIITLLCNHKFHIACFQGWLESGVLSAEGCPLCREWHDIPVLESEPDFQHEPPDDFEYSDDELRCWYNRFTMG